MSFDDIRAEYEKALKEDGVVDGAVVVEWIECRLTQVVRPVHPEDRKSEIVEKLSREIFYRVDEIRDEVSPGAPYERSILPAVGDDGIVVSVAGVRSLVNAVVDSGVLDSAYAYAEVCAEGAQLSELDNPNDPRRPVAPRTLDDGYRHGKLMHQKQEARVAVKLGGEVQRGSGNQPHKRGDVKARELLVECKTTEARSIRVEAKWLEKITREALEAGKEPALNIEIQKVKPGTPRDWTMVPTEMLNDLMDRK